LLTAIDHRPNFLAESAAYAPLPCLGLLENCLENDNGLTKDDSLVTLMVTHESGLPLQLRLQLTIKGFRHDRLPASSGSFLFYSQ